MSKYIRRTNEKMGGIILSILWSIRKTVNQVARALSFAIDTEISIADEDLILVAGSKYYEDLIGKQIFNRIGKKMQDKNIYETIKKQGRPLIISDPGHNELCKGCRLYGKCPEKYEINHPILLEGEIIGIISLVAINEQQKEKLLKNRSLYMNFTSEMANLLAGKAAEWKMSREIKEMAIQLNAIINSTQDGIIAIDKNYKINFINPVAKEILGLKDREKNYRFDNIFPDYSLNDIIKKGSKHTNYELKYVSPSFKKGRIMASITPIEIDENICGAVMVIKTMEEVRDIINSVSGGNRGFSFDQLLGKSAEMEKLIANAKKVAGSNSSILIKGESGTGKELLARAIHAHGYGETAPFVAVNCAAIPSELLESELFGYEEGAFTGAKKGGKQGKFELADGGTLFLDEINSMPLELQAKLLRVLQDKKIRRVGGSKTIDVDVRIVAAYNSNLKDILEKNLDETFRRKDHTVIDVKLEKHPFKLPPDKQNFWGGCQLEFKIVSLENKKKFDKGEISEQQLRQFASVIGEKQLKTFKVDISHFEYCEKKEEKEIDGFPIYIYTPIIIIYEKLRAICQQQEEYKKLIGVKVTPRARDFFDIYSILEHHKDCDNIKENILKEENLKDLKEIFSLKKVPLDLLDNIEASMRKILFLLSLMLKI